MSFESFKKLLIEKDYKRDSYFQNWLINTNSLLFALTFSLKGIINIFLYFLPSILNWKVTFTEENIMWL